MKNQKHIEVIFGEDRVKEFVDSFNHKLKMCKKQRKNEGKDEEAYKNYNSDTYSYFIIIIFRNVVFYRNPGFYGIDSISNM